jgi:hypothetical protein
VAEARLDPRRLLPRLEATAALDRLAGPLHAAVARALPAGRARDLLRGSWLGHAVHPVLTDLPVGFWTSAWVLDLVGGPASAPAATTLVGLGVASAVPTAATGLADWSGLPARTRRPGVVHAGTNAAATALYAASYLARRRGRRGLGVGLGLAGAAAATAGGLLGGDLAFGSRTGREGDPGGGFPSSTGTVAGTGEPRGPAGIAEKRRL